MLHHKTKLLLSLAILLAGCTTTLTSNKLNSSDSPDSVGSTYYLPRQTIRVAVTYQLRACTSGALEPDIVQQATVSTVNGIDPNAKFFVPINSLSSGNKTTQLVISTSENGTLMSLGATVDDRSSEVIGGIVSSAGSILRIATGINPSFSASPNPKCNTDVMTLVKNRDDLTKKLLNPEAFQGEGVRAGAIEALNRLNAATSVTRNISFTPNPSLDEEEKRVSAAANSSASTQRMLNSWLDNSTASKNHVTKLLKTSICIIPGIDGGKKLPSAKNGCSENTLLKQAAPEILSNTDESSQNKNINGIIYRDPKQVSVAVLSGPKTIGRGSVALAQFGPWRSIELTSKAFQDKNVLARWTNAGRLTSLTYGTTSSLEALANTLNTSSTSVRETLGEIITTDQESLNAEIALIRSQADLIEQQNRLSALQNSTTDPIE